MADTTPAKAVDAYIASAPEEQREALAEIRALIRRRIPPADEGMSPNDFALYTIDGEWTAGFATRKKGAMFYLMAQHVLDRHECTLGTLRHGRSCVAWKSSKKLSLDELRKLADIMLRETAAEA